MPGLGFLTGLWISVWGCRDLGLPLAPGPALRVCYPAAAPRPSSSETRDCMRAWLVRSAAGLYVGATYPQTPRLQEAESPPTCTRGWRGLELNGGRVPHALSAVCHSEAQQSRPNTLPSSPLPPRDFRRPAPGPGRPQSRAVPFSPSLTPARQSLLHRGPLTGSAPPPPLRPRPSLLPCLSQSPWTPPPWVPQLLFCGKIQGVSVGARWA